MPLPVAALARRLAANDLRAGDINAFIDIDARHTTTVPLMAASAECGFPSPADDYLDRALDFNELLIENPAATFAVRIAGESMTGAGLFPGYSRRRSLAYADRRLRCVGPARRRVHDQALPEKGDADVATGGKPGLSRYSAK